MWSRRACDGGAEKDAETSPATATKRAKMRMAVFIFGNLISSDVKGNFSLSGKIVVVLFI